MIDLAAFYAAVANEGARPQPHGIDSIEQNGKTIYEYPKTPLPMIGAADRVSFYQLKTMLQGRGGARHRARDRRAVALCRRQDRNDRGRRRRLVRRLQPTTSPLRSGSATTMATARRRSLGSNATGARVALPIFQPIMEAIWAEHIAPKTPLAGPSPEARRELVDVPIDYVSGDRVGTQTNNGGMFRRRVRRPAEPTDERQRIYRALPPRRGWPGRGHAIPARVARGCLLPEPVGATTIKAITATAATAAMASGSAGPITQIRVGKHRRNSRRPRVVYSACSSLGASSPRPGRIIIGAGA